MLHGFFRFRQSNGFRVRSSAGEHYLDMVGVTGSIPVAPTILFNDLGFWGDEKLLQL